MDGNLTVLALTHFGPEQATRLSPPLRVNANGQWRYFIDVIVTWKASDPSRWSPKPTWFATALARPAGRSTASASRNMRPMY
jgi:hypothetical protein